MFPLTLPKDSLVDHSFLALLILLMALPPTCNLHVYFLFTCVFLFFGGFLVVVFLPILLIRVKTTAL